MMAGGQSLSKTAEALGIAKSALSVQLRERPEQNVNDRTANVAQTDTEQANAEMRESTAGSKPLAPSNGQTKRTAQETLQRIARGEIRAHPGQVQALKLVAGTDDEGAQSVYAGIPLQELAERALALACSVLGVRTVAGILSQMTREGMAEVTGKPEELQGEGTPEATREEPRGPLAGEVQASA
jgi:hypothetical protein